MHKLAYGITSDNLFSIHIARRYTANAVATTNERKRLHKEIKLLAGKLAFFVSVGR